MFAALLSMGCMSATAQDETIEVEAFNPHWFVQGQIGGQYTTGETTFGKLLSPNAQLAVGYQMSSVWGLRLAVNGWQSRGGSDILKYDPYKWNYVAPKLDLTYDITNAIGGFKADRVVSLGIFAGIGANIGFNNEEAADRKQSIMTSFPEGYNGPESMEYLWDGTKPRFMGNIGVNLDFKVSKRVKLGLEVSYNATTDHYNSKNAPGKCDHYYNALAGVRVDLGKTTKMKTVPNPIQTRVVEKIVEVVVHDTVYVEKKVAVEPENIRRDVFYNIRGSVISDQEMRKIDEVVAFMKKYPKSIVSVTGYADKGTGNPKINVGYSQKRADVVAATLKQKGISSERIIVSAKGDTEQPYAENDKNRVTICVAQ